MRVRILFPKTKEYRPQRFRLTLPAVWITLKPVISHFMLFSSGKYQVIIASLRNLFGSFFFWVCAVRLLLKEVKLYIIHLFNGEPHKQFNYGVSQICTWSYGPWKDTSLLSLLLHVWKCSEKNLLRLHRGSIPFTYVDVRLTCCDLWPCFSSYALNLWGNRCNCRRFVINPRYQIATMRKIGGSVKV